MSFPTSPTNGQIYSNALGTTYSYDSTKTAWLIVGASGITGTTGTGTNTYLTKWTGTNTIGDARAQEVSNGIAVLGPATNGDTYVSLSRTGTEKVWLTKKVDTDDFSVSLSAYGVDALIIDQTSGVSTFAQDVYVGDPYTGTIHSVDMTATGNVRGAHCASDAFPGITFTQGDGTGNQTLTLGTFDTGQKYIDVPYPSGYGTDYWRIQVKNGLITFIELTLG